MEQLIEAFGIDARLIVIQIINFALLAFLLSYFLYKPLMRVLDEREAKITQGIKDAEAAAAERSNAEDEKRAILTDAHKEADNIALRANTHAEEKAGEKVAAAEDKAATIVKAAEAKSEELKAKAEKDSEAEVAKMAILAAEKVLKERSA
ncbi:F0F1 ATP synthase subunit B [Candidatus Pacebacteria bacterium]|nr:F0F1 ATP synthase subunit B [Candidatus Paceibacterota bacterium]